MVVRVSGHYVICGRPMRDKLVFGLRSSNSLRPRGRRPRRLSNLLLVWLALRRLGLLSCGDSDDGDMPVGCLLSLRAFAPRRLCPAP